MTMPIPTVQLLSRHARIWLCALLLVPAAGGCVFRSTASDKVTGPAALLSEVDGKLRQSGLIDMSSLTITAEDGMVTLTGSVPKADHKARAAELARQVNGVRRVRNELEIHP